MKLFLSLLAILMLGACASDKPTIFLGFKLGDTEDNFVAHIEKLNSSGELNNGKYEFKCGKGSALTFELFNHYNGKLLDELSLSAAGTFKVKDSVENFSTSPDNYSDCVLSAYRQKYGQEQQVDTVQQMSFKWRDPKDLRVKNTYYDGVVHFWQLKGYTLTIKIAINQISWWEGYETYNFNISYTATEKDSKHTMESKTPSSDL